MLRVFLFHQCSDELKTKIVAVHQYGASVDGSDANIVLESLRIIRIADRWKHLTLFLDDWKTPKGKHLAQTKELEPTLH